MGLTLMAEGLMSIRSSYCPSGKMVAVMGMMRLSVFVMTLNSSSTFSVRFTSSTN